MKALMAGMGMSLIFAVLVLTLQTNRVVTGLALTLFGVGLSVFLGRNLVGQTVAPMPGLSFPGLSNRLFIEPLLFRFDAMVYGSVLLVLVLVICFVLGRTRLGLVIRAVGESPHSAHAIGYPVIALRWSCSRRGSRAACCWAPICSAASLYCNFTVRRSGWRCRRNFCRCCLMWRRSSCWSSFAATGKRSC
jgi:ABC-type uncharacterized transport system permease subunit